MKPNYFTFPSIFFSSISSYILIVSHRFLFELIQYLQFEKRPEAIKDSRKHTNIDDRGTMFGVGGAAIRFARRAIDSALISFPCSDGSGATWAAINHVSIYFSRVVTVSFDRLFRCIRNCEMIVGLVADNLASPTSHYVLSTRARRI